MSSPVFDRASMVRSKRQQGRRRRQRQRQSKTATATAAEAPEVTAAISATAVQHGQQQQR